MGQHVELSFETCRAAIHREVAGVVVAGLFDKDLCLGCRLLLFLPSHVLGPGFGKFGFHVRSCQRYIYKAGQSLRHLLHREACHRCVISISQHPQFLYVTDIN